MPATTGQKVGVGIIAFLMILSVGGSSLLFLYEQDSAESQIEEQEAVQETLLAEYEKTNQKVSECTKRASSFTNKDLTVPDSHTSEDEATELVIEDLKEGEGEAVEAGDCVVINYHGSLLSGGGVFDSSFERDTPFSTIIGEGFVIAGWDEGIVGIKKGGERRLIIPADKAYGENGTAPQGTEDSSKAVDEDEDGSIDYIPANSTLVFEVELLDVLKFNDEESTEGEDK